MNPTTTAEPTVEAPATEFVAKQNYVSTAKELRLVVKPERRRQLGDTNDFVKIDGKVITFREGSYETDDPTEIEWLDNHPSNGTLFHKLGMGVDGNTSDNSANLIRDIVALAMRGDFQKIADILVAERASYKRPDVLTACETALHELGTMQAEVDALTAKEKAEEA